MNRQRTRTLPRRVRRDVRGDEGSSALELVLLTPALIALVFALVQTALVWNAQHTVGAAAQQGARMARTATATLSSVSTASAGASTEAEEQVRSATLRYLKQIGGRALQNPTVMVRRDGQYVTVTVAGTTVGVLPGTTVRVSGSSRSPVEGFRP